MAPVIALDPVTRLEGHLKIEVTVDYVNGRLQVVDAKAAGTLFRGFENILINRQPQDAPYITQRICGVCPVSHGMASVMALESIPRTAVPTNARLMRNIVLGSNFVQSHILHFYHLALLDFVDGPAMAPWQPTGTSDRRIAPGSAQAQVFIDHYLAALDMRRAAHEMGAVFGGRMPHPSSIVPGGFTEVPTAAQISRVQSYANQLLGFTDNTYLPDVQALAGIYSDYYTIGRGTGNLIAYGVFDQDATGSTRLLKRGRVAGGSATVQAVDVNAITENVKYGWYADSTSGKNPAAGSTVAQYPKAGAYSWLKAPRYSNVAYEAGPLARMWVNGDYRRGISVMDRHLARAQEARKVLLALQSWTSQVRVGQPVYTRYASNVNGSGFGLTEAPRGALGHWVQTTSGKLIRYQIITPTCWNASPKDSAGTRGPLEQALIGTPIHDMDDPVEVVRVSHSYDPCLSCAVHVMRPREEARIYTLSV